MEQVIFGGTTNGKLDSTATEYNSIMGAYGWNSTLFDAQKLISTSGKIKNMRIELLDAPGAGTSYTITLMLNGAPTALTVEIADTATSGTLVDEVDVVAGDTVSLRCIPTGTPTARRAWWSFIFEGSTANESLIMGGTHAATLSTAAARYVRVMNMGPHVSVTENEMRQVCPTAGTIKNFYVELTEDPGNNGAYKFTLRKGGVSQTLTVTITDPATTGNDTSNEVAVVAGDILTMIVEPIDSPSATPKVRWGMTFVADTDGESIILGGSDNDLHPTNTEYTGIIGRWVWNVSEAYYPTMGQACILKKLYVLLSAAPGADKDYDFTVRIGDPLADSNIVVNIGDAATTGNSGALEDTMSDDDLIMLKVVPTDTPTVVDAYWGLVSYVAPPVAPTPVVDGDLIGIPIIRKS